MIRDRTAADLPACAEVLRDVQPRDGYPSRWPADPEAWLDPPGLLGAWVADHDGAVIGHVGVTPGDHQDGLAAAMGVRTEDLLVVTRLFTAPAARGLGAGRDLLAAVIAFAGDRPLGLDVTAASDGAIAAYERLGWRPIGGGRATWRNAAGEQPMVRWFAAPATN